MRKSTPDFQIHVDSSCLSDPANTEHDKENAMSAERVSSNQTVVHHDSWGDAPGEEKAPVEEMLKGIPLPKTFAPSRAPNEELTTDRYQVGAKVAGTVACLWFRQTRSLRPPGIRMRSCTSGSATSKTSRG